MTESEKSFEAYLDKVIEHAGQVGKRRNVRTLEWRRIAEETWADCMGRQNVARDSERDKQHSPSGT